MSNSSDIYKKKVVVLKFKEPDPSPSLHIRFYMRGKNEIFSLPMIFVELKKKVTSGVRHFILPIGLEMQVLEGILPRQIHQRKYKMKEAIS